MKRFRLSTLMLLIVIVGLCVALVVQQQRSARREAELQAKLAHSIARYDDMLIERDVELRNSDVAAPGVKEGASR